MVLMSRHRIAATHHSRLGNEECVPSSKGHTPRRSRSPLSSQPRFPMYSAERLCTTLVKQWLHWKAFIERDWKASLLKGSRLIRGDEMN
jgi:hypothetical protein